MMALIQHAEILSQHIEMLSQHVEILTQHIEIISQQFKKIVFCGTNTLSYISFHMLRY